MDPQKHLQMDILVANLNFTATSLEYETIEMSFSEISTRYPEDDIFYFNNGKGDPVPCFLSTLAIQVQVNELQNNLADIIGKWPGDESVEEILKNL